MADSGSARTQSVSTGSSSAGLDQRVCRHPRFATHQEVLIAEGSLLWTALDMIALSCCLAFFFPLSHSFAQSSRTLSQRLAREMFCCNWTVQAACEGKLCSHAFGFLARLSHTVNLYYITNVCYVHCLRYVGCVATFYLISQLRNFLSQFFTRNFFLNVTDSLFCKIIYKHMVSRLENCKIFEQGCYSKRGKLIVNLKFTGM